MVQANLNLNENGSHLVIRVSPDLKKVPCSLQQVKAYAVKQRYGGMESNMTSFLFTIIAPLLVFLTADGGKTNFIRL